MIRKSHNTNGLRPVERIDVPEINVRKRLVLVIALAVIAFTALGIAISRALSRPSGWTAIEARTGSPGCAGEFSFQYCLDSKGSSAQYKAVSALYTAACEKAVSIFGKNTLSVLSEESNEPVNLEPEMVNAIRILKRYDSRIAYLAPLYETYDSLFFCTEDEETVDYDPAQNPELAALFSQLAEYASDPEHIDIVVCDDSSAILSVSEEYLRFASDNGCDTLFDLGWMRNAFIIDYIAGELRTAGYTHGYIQSYDGFVVNLCETDETFAMSVFDRNETGEYLAARMDYTGPVSFTALRSYSLNPSVGDHYYELRDGRIISCFLDPADGVSKTSIDDLLMWSSSLGCAELLMRCAPVFISSTFDPSGLASENAEYLYCIDNVIVCSASNVSFPMIGEGYRVISG